MNWLIIYIECLLQTLRTPLLLLLQLLHLARSRRNRPVSRKPLLMLDLLHPQVVLSSSPLRPLLVIRQLLLSHQVCYHDALFEHLGSSVFCCAVTVVKASTTPRTSTVTKTADTTLSSAVAVTTTNVEGAKIITTPPLVTLLSTSTEADGALTTVTNIVANPPNMGNMETLSSNNK